MEHQKILNLLNEAIDSKVLTRKWNIVNDQSKANYDIGNEILVKGNITVAAAPATQVSFKNCAPFIKCITKIDGTTIDNVKDLDIVMSMYNLIEYSSNYS